ncbi:hypothetical protein AJ88_13810 [Mesorhizobium amorphae CCBAU 01583]|nr:hypothetical protein AJ88_13810 [Mesorhizobium amorphae CCBAU 01583]
MFRVCSRDRYAAPGYPGGDRQECETDQALKISGTPGFVVDDHIFPGATDLATMKKLIEQARVLQK